MLLEAVLSSLGRMKRFSTKTSLKWMEVLSRCNSSLQPHEWSGNVVIANSIFRAREGAVFVSNYADVASDEWTYS